MNPEQQITQDQKDKINIIEEIIGRRSTDRSLDQILDQITINIKELQTNLQKLLEKDYNNTDTLLILTNKVLIREIASNNVFDSILEKARILTNINHQITILLHQHDEEIYIEEAETSNQIILDNWKRLEKHIKTTQDSLTLQLQKQEQFKDELTTLLDI